MLWCVVFLSYTLANGLDIQRHDGALRRAPRGSEFFREPPREELAVGFGAGHGNRSCTPQCSWACSTPQCDTKCKPLCRAPVCQTACAKPKISQCKQVCEEPTCSLVCHASRAAACATGECPDCDTVCSKPKCRLDCGQARMCRSTCADPVCAWDCEAASCPEPDCKLQCTTPKFCGLARSEPTLREIYVGQGREALNGHAGIPAEYADREVAWQGLAAVPEDRLVAGPAAPVAPLQPTGAQPMRGAKMPNGAKPLTGNPCPAFCIQAPGLPCSCGISAQAEVSPVARWVVVSETPAMRGEGQRTRR